MALTLTQDDLDAISAVVSAAIAGTAVTIVGAKQGNHLAATIGATLAATLSGLTISSTWSKVYFTVKERAADADASSIVQVVVSNPAVALTDGALYVQKAGASAAQRTQGGLTVTQAAGTVAIALDEALTGALREKADLVYDVKEITSGGAANVLCVGTFSAAYGVTWAVS
jgi:hypothetical protein